MSFGTSNRGDHGLKSMIGAMRVFHHSNGAAIDLLRRNRFTRDVDRLDNLTM
jgi:hypothetical protein